MYLGAERSDGSTLSDASEGPPIRVRVSCRFRRDWKEACGGFVVGPPRGLRGDSAFRQKMPGAVLIGVGASLE